MHTNSIRRENILAHALHAVRRFGCLIQLQDSIAKNAMGTHHLEELWEIQKRLAHLMLR